MKKIFTKKKYILCLLLTLVVGVFILGVYKANSLKYYYSVLAVRFENSDKKPKVLVEGVPFVSQTGYDDELLKIGCEEAALVMVESYLSGKKPTKEEKGKAMQDLVKYQKENYGGHNQIGAERLLKLSKDFYGIDGEVVKTDRTKEINKSLDSGNPVIVPALAKHLKNPLYSEKGYHMIVIIGYNGSGYFAHDPGTAGGSYFFYPKEVISEAIYDVETKDKKILILRR